MQDQLSLTASADSSDETPGPRAELRDPAVTVAFMLAGNAHVTFQSRRTGTRFTYRVRAKVGAAPSLHFVAVLTGPDNGASYEYLGCIYGRKMYAHGRKSRITEYAPSATAFAWVWRYLSGGKTHPELAVYHEGRCGRCSRRLTDPTSIERGLGSFCATRLGL